MEIQTTPDLAVTREQPVTHKGRIDWSIFLISGGFFVLFLVAALVNLSWLSTLVDTVFGWATRAFGLYWQVLMLATFVIRNPGQRNTAKSMLKLAADSRPIAATNTTPAASALAISLTTLS